MQVGAQRQMIIITGAAGFIGSNISARLNDLGYDNLILVDDLASCDKWKNLLNTRFLDLIPRESLIEFLKENSNEISTVFHLGANSSTAAKDGDAILRTNVIPSMKIWNWCSEHSKKLIYASSAATYGDGSDGFSDERDVVELEKLKPANLYAWSKHTFDRWALLRSQKGIEPLNWVGLKFFNVYGQNEDHKGNMRSMVSKCYDSLKSSRHVQLFKSYRSDISHGEQERDFIHVNDCVNVMQWFMGDNRPSGIFNVGTGTPRTFSDLVETLAVELGTKPRINYIDMPDELLASYQYSTCADVAKLRSVGYSQPFLSLEEGVREFVKSKARITRKPE